MKFLVCLSFSLFACILPPLQAKDLAAYHAGDTVEADIVTPVAMDVVDPEATAALQSARATQYPAVFRSFPGSTNEMTREFLDAFAKARSDFLSELAGQFPSAKLDDAVIASDDFSRLVAAFGVKHKRFPVTDDLAGEWARGGDGQAIRANLLAALLSAVNRRVRPDSLPKGMIVGETIRLVPVTEESQKLSFDTVQKAQIVPAASLTTLSNAQALLHNEFPAGQQLFARALADFLKPNCLPDAPFTQLTRGAAVCQMIVSDHFDAGDAIVRQGETIDAKTQAALAALKEVLNSNPPSRKPAGSEAEAPSDVAERRKESGERAGFPVPLDATQSAPRSPAATSPAVAMPTQRPVVTVVTPPPAALKAGSRRPGLILTLAGVSAAALMGAGWQRLKNRKNDASRNGLPSDSSLRGLQAPAPAGQTPLPFPEASQSDLTPQVTQAVREAVQQELASQRRELLLAQQAASVEITALVRRLDELQVPMHERLRAYETRIQSLEKELALRNEENRQLLKLKIEMVTRQLETERAATLAPPPG